MRRRLIALLFALPMLAASTAQAQVRPLKLGQCEACHGADGRGRAPGIPNLAAQDEAYLVSALLAYRGGQRRHPVMNSIANTLQPRDVQGLARWYASRPPARAR